MSDYLPERFRVSHRSRDGQDLANTYNNGEVAASASILRLALDGAPASGRRYGHALHALSLYNNHAAELRAFVGGEIPLASWGAGQWVDATPIFNDDTTDAQDADANDFALETTTNFDGFVAYADRPFNALLAEVTTPTVKGAALYASDLAFLNGSTWTALTQLSGPASGTGYIVTANDEILTVWKRPDAWAPSTGAGVSGIPGGKFAVRYRATVAPATTAGLAKRLRLFNLRYVEPAIASSASTTRVGLGALPVTSDDEALVACFQLAATGHRAWVTTEKIDAAEWLGHTSRSAV